MNATLISEARHLYSEIIKLRELSFEREMRIAQIGFELCPRKRGNFRDKQDHYTLKDFSQDTGIPFTTLSEWINTYERTKPVLGKIASNEDWLNAKRLNRKIRKSNSNRDIIERKGDKEKSEFQFYRLTIKSIIEWPIEEYMDLFSKNELGQFMGDLDFLSDKINDYLTAFSKKSEH